MITFLIISFSISITLFAIGTTLIWRDRNRFERERDSAERRLKTAVSALRRIAARDMKATNNGEMVEGMGALAQRTLDAVDHGTRL